jgi:hypothetical protein
MITNDLRPGLHGCLGGLVGSLHGTPLEINGTTNHVHVLAKINPVIRFPSFLAIQITIVRLGRATVTRKIQMAGEIRGVHSESITD